MKTAKVPVGHDVAASADEADRGYVVPLVHVRMSARVVQLAFWGALGATVVAGAVDLPVAAAVAGGVVIARHVRR